MLKFSLTREPLVSLESPSVEKKIQIQRGSACGAQSKPSYIARANARVLLKNVCSNNEPPLIFGDYHRLLMLSPRLMGELDTGCLLACILFITIKIRVQCLNTNGA